MQSETVTKSEQETIEMGGRLMKKAMLDVRDDQPLVFCLYGELGTGKTQFVKGMADELGLNGITSPTFLLMRKFILAKQLPGNTKKGKKYFFHIDCYRIYDSEEARQISLDKTIASPRAIVAIEWAERIAEIIPRPYLEKKFEYDREAANNRKISIKKIQ
jgi:tRNA threonylcarbamoyladenosine biosynthesis protein TsaE